jgi:hypothetical protein
VYVAWALTTLFLRSSGHYNTDPSCRTGVLVRRLPLSLDDQRDFDSYYARWVDDTRANDQDYVSRDAGHMQAIMARNNIPAENTL